MLKKSLIIISAFFLLSTCNTFAQEKDDPVINKIDALKNAYYAKDIELTLAILNELENILINNKKKKEEIKNYNLFPLMNILKDEAFSKIKWLLAIDHSHPDYPLKSEEQVLRDLNSLGKFKPQEDAKKEIIQEYKLVSLYIDEIKSLINTFGLIGSDTGLFFYDKELPVRFFNLEGKLGIIITKIANNKIYNTLQSTAKKRAAKVISSNIIPELNNIHNSFKSTEISYYGMVISYGSKNFIDDSSVPNLMTEQICLIVSNDCCLKFITGEITETELLNECVTYLCDRNMIGNFKKIKIKIE